MNASLWIEWDLTFERRKDVLVNEDLQPVTWHAISEVRVCVLRQSRNRETNRE